MKTLRQPYFHLAAAFISGLMNVLFVSTLDAALTSQQAQPVSYVQLPSVTVVSKRPPLTGTQLVAASSIKTL